MLILYSKTETMATSKITYKGGLRTTSVHERSGNEIITDAPVDNKGKGEAFSPTDLLATSLGNCMLTIVGIAANEHGFSIDGATCEITKIMAENPRRVSEIVVNFQFPSNAYSDKDKKIIERSAHTCPVALSLHPDLKQTVSFNY
jgi:putative redox protein